MYGPPPLRNRVSNLNLVKTTHLELQVCFPYWIFIQKVQSVPRVLAWGRQVLQFVASASVCRADFTRCLFVFQDLLQLVACVLRLAGKGSYRNLYAQNVRDHVGTKPTNQRGAAGGVVSLSVVEEQTIHLQP